MASSAASAVKGPPPSSWPPQVFLALPFKHGGLDCAAWFYPPLREGLAAALAAQLHLLPQEALADCLLQASNASQVGAASCGSHQAGASLFDGDGLVEMARHAASGGALGGPRRWGAACCSWAGHTARCSAGGAVPEGRQRHGGPHCAVSTAAAPAPIPPPSHPAQAGWPAFQQQLERFLAEGAWSDPLLKPRALQAAQRLLQLGYNPLAPNMLLWRKVRAGQPGGAGLWLPGPGTHCFARGLPWQWPGPLHIRVTSGRR
jgi:hypothetical protein